MRRKLLLSILVLVLSGAGIVYIFLIDVGQPSIPLPQPDNTVIIEPIVRDDVDYEPINLANTSEQRLRFFRDNLTLVERDYSDSPRVLKFELNRREDTPNDFIHYYSAVFMHNGESIKERTSFNSPDADVKANGFIKSIANLIANDLSSREEYEFDINLDGLDFGATLHNLDGDFVTKIQPGYNRYTSVGIAKATIGDEEILFNASLEKIYGDDYSRWIFFDGVQDLESTTDKLIMWDDQGNYYLLDTTTTNKPSHAYRPHTWVLHKKATGANLKAFDAKITREKLTDDLWNWKLDFPDFGVKLDVDGLHLSGVEREYGVVEGELFQNSQVRKVNGFFVYKPR